MLSFLYPKSWTEHVRSANKIQITAHVNTIAGATVQNHTDQRKWLSLWKDGQINLVLSRNCRETQLSQNKLVAKLLQQGVSVALRNEEKSNIFFKSCGINLVAACNLKPFAKTWGCTQRVQCLLLGQPYTELVLGWWYSHNYLQRAVCHTLFMLTSVEEDNTQNSSLRSWPRLKADESDFSHWKPKLLCLSTGASKKRTRFYWPNRRKV